MIDPETAKIAPANERGDFLRVIKPCMKYRESFIRAEDENIAANIYEFTRLSPDERASESGFSSYIRKLEDYRRGFRLPNGYVPSSSFWLVDEDKEEFIGQASIRHFMTESLKTFGGHIGYAIRPSFWNKGYGTAQLALLLPEAKKLGINLVRLTCYASNTASSRIMEKNGGKRIREIISNINGVDTAVWIYEIEN